MATISAPNEVSSIDAPGLDSNFLGLMVLDTACQRTFCRKEWALGHEERLKADDNLAPAKTDCTDAFQFGSGKPLSALHRAYFPCGIGGTDVAIGAGVLEAQIPLLASNQLLDLLGMVLNLPEGA